MNGTMCAMDLWHSFTHQTMHTVGSAFFFKFRSKMTEEEGSLLLSYKCTPTATAQPMVQSSVYHKKIKFQFYLCTCNGPRRNFLTLDFLASNCPICWWFFVRTEIIVNIYRCCAEIWLWNPCPLLDQIVMYRKIPFYTINCFIYCHRLRPKMNSL